MVKREKIVPGYVVQVARLTPGPPGPFLQVKFAVDELVTITSLPFQRGGLNLVTIQRHSTSTNEVVFYSFITNFCKAPRA